MFNKKIYDKLNLMLSNAHKTIKIEKDTTHNLTTLVGMMGTGKSKFGYLVANKLKLKFYDIDVIIEKKFNSSIKNLFKTHGEKIFRIAEKEEIFSLIDKAKINKEKAIISIGGGGFENLYTRNLLLKYTKVIWLNTPSSTLIKRIGDGSKRPMIQGNIKKSINDILKKRTKHYVLSHYELNTELLSQKEIIDKIIQISA